MTRLDRVKEYKY